MLFKKLVSIVCYINKEGLKVKPKIIAMNLKSVLQEILIFASISSAILVIISKNPVISVIYLISLVLNTALYLIVKGIYYIGISYILIYIGAIIVLFLFVIMMINIRLTDILEIGFEYTKNIPLGLTVSGLLLFELINVLPSYLNTLSFPLESNLITLVREFLVSLTYTFYNTIISLINGTISATGLQETIINSEYYMNNLNILGNLSSLTFNNWPETLIENYSQITGVAYSLYTIWSFWFLLCGLILLLAMLAPIYISKIN